MVLPICRRPRSTFYEGKYLYVYDYSGSDFQRTEQYINEQYMLIQGNDSDSYTNVLSQRVEEDPITFTYFSMSCCGWLCHERNLHMTLIWPRRLTANTCTSVL